MIALPVVLELLCFSSLLLVLLRFARMIQRRWRDHDYTAFEAWGAGQGIRIVDIKGQTGLFHGSPWKFFRMGERLYRIRAVDTRGMEISGWAHCGGICSAEGAQQVEVLWDP